MCAPLPFNRLSQRIDPVKGKTFGYDTAADLSATEDIALTPAITALAASLNHSPVKIYNWVRNNIEYLTSCLVGQD